MRALKIGTRGSPLALAQAHETRDRLIKAGAAESCEIVAIRTTGDKIQDRALGEAGGKGLFTLEIDEQLLNGDIDIAVHSMKDAPTELPAGLTIGAMLPREDVRDAFISHRHTNIDALPQGATVGTASLRRQAQLLFRRPDLKVTTFRGTVQTRLRKIEEGEVDATFLAMAGLNRLGAAQAARAPISTNQMLPAAAQGAIGVARRVDDAQMQAALRAIAHEATEVTVSMERAFLAQLDGSCRTPIGALAERQDGGALRFRGEILKPDGSERHVVERFCASQEAQDVARAAAQELLAAAGPNFLA